MEPTRPSRSRRGQPAQALGIIPLGLAGSNSERRNVPKNPQKSRVANIERNAVQHGESTVKPASTAPRTPWQPKVSVGREAEDDPEGNAGGILRRFFAVIASRAYLGSRNLVEWQLPVHYEGRPRING